MANTQHLEVYAGANQTFTLAGRDETNTPTSLTSKTITWYVGRPPFRPDNRHQVISKTGSVVSASAGTFTVSVTPSDTQYMNGDYQHMAFTTDGSGNIATVCQGRFRILPQLVN